MTEDVPRYHLKVQKRAWNVTGILHDPLFDGRTAVAPLYRLPKFEEIFRVPAYATVAGDPVLSAFAAARRVYQARKPRYRELLARRSDLTFSELASVIMRDIEHRLLDVHFERWLGFFRRPRFSYFDARRFPAHRAEHFERAMKAARRLAHYRLHQA